jgi:hypothetical protein
MRSPLDPIFLSVFLSPTLTHARDITFPPQIPIHSGSKYVSSFENPGLDPTIHHSRYNGLNTFANLPYVYCLNDAENDHVENFDIAFLGAGFDTVSFFLNHFVVLVGSSGLLRVLFGGAMIV